MITQLLKQFRLRQRERQLVAEIREAHAQAERAQSRACELQGEIIPALSLELADIRLAMRTRAGMHRPVLADPAARREPLRMVRGGQA